MRVSCDHECAVGAFDLYFKELTGKILATKQLPPMPRGGACWPRLDYDLLIAFWPQGQTSPQPMDPAV